VPTSSESSSENARLRILPAKIAVDDPVLLDLEPTELAAEVGQRGAFAGHRARHVGEEHAVRARHDVLRHAALAVGQ
jgi:hypothetical protein